MSYILDALKKSEQERARGAIPDIKTIHQPRHVESKKSSHWLYLALIVLLLNAGGFGFWIYQQHSRSAAENPLTSAADIVTAKSDKVTSLESQPSKSLASDKAQQELEQLAQNLRVLEDSSNNRADSKLQENQKTAKPGLDKKINSSVDKPNVIFSDKPLTVSENELANAETVGDLTALSDVEIIPEGSVTPQPSEPAEVMVDKIYDIAELPDSVKRGLPAISFAGHVYSSTQSQRSVMLNGKKMREGQEVTKGLLLEQITIDGVVMRAQGYRFKLAALQDWSFQ